MPPRRSHGFGKGPATEHHVHVNIGRVIDPLHGHSRHEGVPRRGVVRSILDLLGLGWLAGKSKEEAMHEKMMKARAEQEQDPERTKKAEETAKRKVMQSG